MLDVRRIEAAETRPLRRSVLRPHQAEAELVYPGDDDATTLHVGAWLADALVGVASLYAEALEGEPLGFRLRGMAVEPARQGIGVGRELVSACLTHATAQQGALVWCNARVSALGFYERLGFVRRGDVFEISGIGPHYVMLRRLRG